MSFCRWSDMNWSCDLYCYYEAAGGITTHVATKRVIGEVPPVPSQTKTPVDKYLKYYEKQMAFLKTAEHEDIGLLEDGNTYNDPDLETLKERLVELREMGYKFPDYMLELKEEDEK